MVNDDIMSLWQSINLAIRHRHLNNMKSSLNIINYIKSKSNCPIVSSACPLMTKEEDKKSSFKELFLSSSSSN